MVVNIQSSPLSIEALQATLIAVPTNISTPPVDKNGMLILRSGAPLHDPQLGHLSAQQFTDALFVLAEKLRDVKNAPALNQEIIDRPPRLPTTITPSPKANLIEILDRLESQVILEIIKHAEENSLGQHALLQRCAQSSTIADQGLARMQEYIRKTSQENPTDLAKNSSIIKQSWIGNHHDIAQAVACALEHKQAEYGRARLVMWNDVDQNLTLDNAHNELTPGLRYAKVAYQTHGRQLLEPIVFEALYNSIYTATLGSLPFGKIVYESTGLRVPHLNILPEVREAFKFAHEHNLDCRLLTRNLRWVADGVARTLGVPSYRIYGRTHENHETTNKPAVILRGILEDPTTVHVIADDGDESLLAGLKAPCLEDGSKISDHAFIITRANSENRSYELGALMNELRLPHGSQLDNYATTFSVLRAAAKVHS